MSNSDQAGRLCELQLKPSKSTEPAVLALQEASQARLGYVRNFLQLPFAPGLLALYQGYIDKLMRGDGGLLPHLERELIALVVSAENRCEVCVISHATALERLGMAKETVDVLSLSWRRADLSPRQRALAEFAWRLTAHASEADESYIGNLRLAGLSDQEIFEVAQIASLYNANNRFNSVIGLHVNPEAHAAYRKR